MSLIGSSSEVKSLHDTTEISANDGFEVSQDCTLVFRLRGDSSDTTWAYFLKGVFYSHDIKLAKSSGSTGGTTLLVIRGRAG